VGDRLHGMRRTATVRRLEATPKPRLAAGTTLSVMDKAWPLTLGSRNSHRRQIGGLPASSDHASTAAPSKDHRRQGPYSWTRGIPPAGRAPGAEQQGKAHTRVRSGPSRHTCDQSRHLHAPRDRGRPAAETGRQRPPSPHSPCVLDPRERIAAEAKTAQDPGRHPDPPFGIHAQRALHGKQPGRSPGVTRQSRSQITEHLAHPSLVARPFGSPPATTRDTWRRHFGHTQEGLWNHRSLLRHGRTGSTCIGKTPEPSAPLGSAPIPVPVRPCQTASRRRVSP
jgi:hypothetical protein